MSLLGQTSITRRRYTAGTRATTGYWTTPAATDTTILASVQEASGEDLQVLPEGERKREAVKVYTETAELRTANQHAGIQADRVVISSIVYEVAHTEQRHPLIPHYKALATRLQEGA